MTSYRITPAARRDLSSIWDFTAETWDLQQAESYVTEIRAAIGAHPAWTAAQLEAIP